jgi:hypothetical protein
VKTHSERLDETEKLLADLAKAAELWTPTVATDGGPWAKHNMPCPVCLDNRAVLNIGTGRFDVCWKCQRIGWGIVRLPKWLYSVLKIIGIKERP